MQTLLKKLITFNTDKDHPQEQKGCVEFVVSDLKKAGLKVKTYTSNGKTSIIAGRTFKKHYQYFLNGHLDVVPATYPKAFEPKVKGNKLYGRGASDMKGPTVALIDAMKDPELKNIDMALMLNFDEEVGGFDGAKYLINNQGYSCDCVIVPDGGDNFELVLAEKGVLHVKLTALGKAAHGSQPWVGDNALEKLIAIFTEIKSKLKPTTLKNRWLPTVNLGKISGGDAPNKVPAQAEMLLDFRYPKKEHKEKILGLIKQALKKQKRVSLQILSEGAPVDNSPKNKYVQKMLKVAKLNKIKMKIAKCHGASDGRFFSEKGMPVIMFKPVCSPAHVDNEWLDLKSLDKFFELLKSFLLN